MYYYKSLDGRRTWTLFDNDSNFTAFGKTPYQLFNQENNTTIWWHVNDRTGKIDMNINKADLSIRKEQSSLK